LKIEGKLTGEVEGITVPRNAENDGMIAKVNLVVRVNRDECKRYFGEIFTDSVAFSGMVERTDGDGKTEYVHLNAPKMTSKIVVEMHDIQIWGRKLTGVQPDVVPKPVQGEPKVDVLIRIPVDIGEHDKFDLAVIRAAKRGTKVKAEFNPKQGGLSLAPRKPEEAKAEA
jgi:hypothetical protein